MGQSQLPVAPDARARHTTAKETMPFRDDELRRLLNARSVPHDDQCAAGLRTGGTARPGHRRASRSAEQEIIKLSKDKWLWMAERNVDALDKLFAPEAVFVHMGGTMTKSQELEHHQERDDSVQGRADPGGLVRFVGRRRRYCSTGSGWWRWWAATRSSTRSTSPRST